MNATKWLELRDAMHQLEDLSPRWRTLDLSGYQHFWVGDWFHEFYGDGCETIEQVEIKVNSQEMRDAVRRELVRIHLPGKETDVGFIVYGYTRGSEDVEYIQGSC